MFVIKLCSYDKTHNTCDLWVSPLFMRLFNSDARRLNYLQTNDVSSLALVISDMSLKYLSASCVFSCDSRMNWTCKFNFQFEKTNWNDKVKRISMEMNKPMRKIRWIWEGKRRVLMRRCFACFRRGKFKGIPCQFIFEWFTKCVTWGRQV